MAYRALFIRAIGSLESAGFFYIYIWSLFAIYNSLLCVCVCARAYMYIFGVLVSSQYFEFQALYYFISCRMT